MYILEKWRILCLTIHRKFEYRKKLRINNKTSEKNDQIYFRDDKALLLMLKLMFSFFHTFVSKPSFSLRENLETMRFLVSQHSYVLWLSWSSAGYLKISWRLSSSVTSLWISRESPKIFPIWTFRSILYLVEDLRRTCSLDLCL